MAARSDTGAESCLDEGALLDWAQGLVSAEALPPMEAHVASCDRCRALLAEALRALSSDEPPEGGDSRGRVRQLGRYQLQRFLGEGGMGTVFEAFDPGLERKVALKLVRWRGGEISQVAKERLAREGKAMARVAHPNVVAVYDVGAEGHQVYVAMELVEGPTLKAWLAATGGLRPWEEVVGAFVAAARGLHAAHEQGVLHRDFKPDNVLVGRDGRVRVADFGLAELGDVAAGSAAGTFAYLSPEQLERRPLDARSDQWSLAAALFEGLTRARPFAESGIDARLAQIRQGPAWPRRPRLPRSLQRTVERGVAFEPSARFDSLAHLGNALEQSLASARRRRRAARAAPWAAGALALLSVGLAKELQRRALVRPCEGSAALAQAIWRPDVAARMAAALNATGKPHAKDAAARTSEGLTAYVGLWERERASVCGDSVLLGERAQAVAPARLECLDDRLREARAVVDLLSTPDAAMADYAAQSVEGLADPAQCRRRHPVSASGAGGETAQPEVREAIARASALRQLGRFPAGLEAAERAVRLARAARARSLEAEALAAQGWMYERLGRYSDAAATLKEASFAADASGQDDLALRCRIFLMQLLSSQLSSVPAAHALEPHVQAGIERLSRPEELVALFKLARAISLQAEGSLEAAGTAAAEAEAAFARLGPSQHGRRVTALQLESNLLEQRGEHLVDAERLARQALSLNEARLGPSHPALLPQLKSLAVLARKRGALEEADELLSRGLAIANGSLGADHPRVAELLTTRGLLASQRGRHAAAVEALTRALQIREHAYGPAHVEVGAALSNLGTALVRASSAAEASAALLRARDVLSAALGERHPYLADVYRGLGELELQRGQRLKAVGELERSLALQDRKQVRDLARGELLLSSALASTQPARAKALAESALQRLSAQPALDAPLYEAAKAQRQKLGQ